MNLKKTEFYNVRPHAGDEDWRNVAVNEGLGISSSEWVWFIEQDFFIEDYYVIDDLFTATNTYDCIGFWEAERLHPACLLVKRDLIMKTRRDFGAYEKDHFGRFSEDIVAQLGENYIGTFEKLSLVNEFNYYHMQGLTHNYNLIRQNDLGKVYKRDEFLTYNQLSTTLDVVVSDDYLEEVGNVESKLGEYKENEMIIKMMKFLKP